MTTRQYIDLAHSYSTLARFYDELPNLFNGEWTIDGNQWYPCVILDDNVGEGKVKIVTRNQTHMVELAERVRRLR